MGGMHGWAGCVEDGIMGGWVGCGDVAWGRWPFRSSPL